MKMIGKFLLLNILMVTFVSMPVKAAEVDFDRNGNGRVSSREVKKLMKAGALDEARTCMDEYSKRSKHLAIKVGVLPPAAGGAWVAAGYATVGAAAASANLAGVILAAVFFAYFVTIPAAIALVITEGVSIFRLVRTNQIIRFLAEARMEKGKKLQKYFKSFVRKYRKYRNSLTVEQFAKAVVAVDETGDLCNGVATGRSANAKLRKRLAKRKQIFRLVDKQLASQPAL